jgi:hypothetical protein
MSYTIVIAKYNENMDWLVKMDQQHIRIYNKGTCTLKNENVKNRENIGREAETYLYHIIENYNNLPDYLILIQGNPFDHMKNITPDTFQNKINEKIKNVHDIEGLFSDYISESHYKYPGIKTKEYYNFLFGENTLPPESVFSPGCQYIIPRENILSRPLEFYKNFHYMTLHNTFTTANEAHFNDIPFDHMSIHPWCVERLFRYIFIKNIPSSIQMLQKR